jgi:hypothetical protein
MELTIPQFTPAEIVTINNLFIGLFSALSSMYIGSKLPVDSTMTFKSIFYRSAPAIIGIIIMTYAITHYTSKS